MTRNEAILTAVNWWSNKLKMKQPHDNGDKSFTSFVANGLSDMMMENIEAEQLDTFEIELMKLIELEYEHGWYNLIFLSCDYSPCEMLSKAAKKAGINEFNFPYKVNVVINKKENTVKVSDGYAQPYQNLQFIPWKPKEE